jgi:hypothetical protein
MVDQNGRQTPPYISFATFENFINGLNESGVPDKIDSSLMRTLSGSARSGLMVALRYLRLIDEDNITLAALDKLAKAKSADRSGILREILTQAYGFLNKEAPLDLGRATPAQLADAIGEEGATGGTRDKAVVFFLKSAEAAGIPISPHILKGKHARSSPTAKRIKRAVGKKPAAKPSVHSNDNPRDSETRVARSPYDVLMNEIYNPAEMKERSAEEKAVFTLARYLKSKGVEA